MNLFAKFQEALPYAEFMARHGTPAYDARWRRTFEQVTLTPAQRELLGQFTRETNVLVLAGAWCGDCSAQCPIFDRFAEAAPVLTVRYLDRDAHPDAQRELRINGGDRVPVVVFFSEDGHSRPELRTTARTWGTRLVAEALEKALPEVTTRRRGEVRRWRSTGLGGAARRRATTSGMRGGSAA
jgi:hypothetical protein